MPTFSAVRAETRPPNNTLEGTAGSHSLAPAGHRERHGDIS
jgi:hypothetical protein